MGTSSQPSTNPSISHQPSLAPTDVPSTSLSPTQEPQYVSTTASTKGEVQVENSRRRLQGTRCQTQEFTSALQNALRNAIRLGLPLDYYVLDVIVDPAQAANCFFPFEAQV